MTDKLVQSLFDKAGYKEAKPENAKCDCDWDYTSPLCRNHDKPEKPKATRKNCGSSSSSKAALLPTKKTKKKDGE